MQPPDRVFSLEIADYADQRFLNWCDAGEARDRRFRLLPIALRMPSLHGDFF